MTKLGNPEIFWCCFFGCVWYRRDCLGFYTEETIRYTIVLFLSTIVLRCKTWLTWVFVIGWLVISGYDLESEMHFMTPRVSW